MSKDTSDKIDETLSNLKDSIEESQTLKKKGRNWLESIGENQEELELQEEVWRDLKTNPTQIPEAVADTGVNMSKTVLSEYQKLNSLWTETKIDDSTSTAGTAVTTGSGIVASGATLSYPPDKLPQSFRRLDAHLSGKNEKALIEKRLRKIEPNLADQYNNAWTNLYTEVEDKTRSPLFLIREVYRRLMQKYAPDDVVMGKYELKEKKGINKYRVRYIASQLPPEKRGVFLEEEEAFRDIYGTLSGYAHKPGKLDVKKTKPLLYQANGLIKLLLDSFEK